MSEWTARIARLNAVQLRRFGERVSIANPGAVFTTFTGQRITRQALENESAGAFESLWTTTAEMPVPALAGATVQLGTAEYVLVENGKPDEDPDSNGITLLLNRKRSL